MQLVDKGSYYAIEFDGQGLGKIDKRVDLKTLANLLSELTNEDSDPDGGGSDQNPPPDPGVESTVGGGGGTDPFSGDTGSETKTPESEGSGQAE